MRWDNLFDDLESQLESELSAEELDLEFEEERLRLSRLGMRDRIVALHRGAASTDPLRVTLCNGDRHVLLPASFGRDWFSASFADRPGRVVVPLAAVAGVSLSAAQVRVSLQGSAESSLSDRLGLPFVLRDLCRRRRGVGIVLADATLHGTIDRVGRDPVDVALHEPGSARRESAVREFRLVPIAAIVLVEL